MDTRGWERAKEIFYEALELSPDERKGLLRRVDPEVRIEVEGLLAANERAREKEADAGLTPEGPGSVIGRYKILQEIGEGGFGVVYMAEQEEPVRRKVALKVIKLGMDTGQVVARFEAERQALAIMDHPNIAKVLDAGATETGRPYFVMELVKGIPISEYCDQAALDTRERLDLFTKVCRAVQHAHRKGIIHRDLKPTNVLVTLHDGKPVPKVIDFGIAKAMDRRLTEKTLFTEFRQIIGTPEYMAPEQAELSSLDIDTRADVYSLGVLLYELLTGSKPFELRTLLEKGWNEILRHIREVDPPKPSTRLSTLGEELTAVAKNRHTPAKLLGKLVKGDLDWIVMKALEKDRSRRYDSADAMALDVERYLEDQPVLATPPSAAYRIRKYVRRHRVAVAAVAAVLLALVAGLVLSAVGFLEANRQRADAVAERDEARRARAAEASARQAADLAADQARAERDAKESARADLADALGRSEGTRLLAQSQAVLPRDPSLALLLAIEGAERAPGFDANQALLNALESAPQREVVLDGGPYRVAEFGPRGERVVTGSADGKVRIHDVETGEVVRVLDPGSGVVQEVRWAGQSDRVVTASSHGDLAVWDPSSGERLRNFPAGRSPAAPGAGAGSWGIRIATDGSRCVLNPPDGQPRIVNLESGEVEFELPDSYRGTWAMSDNGKVFVAVSTVRSGDAATLTCWLVGSSEPVHSWPVAWNAMPGVSPDGRYALAKDAENVLQLLDLGSGEVVFRREDSRQGVTCSCFTPDGRRVAIGSGDTVRILDTASGRLCREIEDVQATFYIPPISADGERIIFLNRDSAPRFNVYCVSTGEVLATLPERASYSQGAFSPDGGRILGFHPGGRAAVWFLGPDPLTFLGHGALEFVPLSSDGRRALSSTFFTNAPVRVWDLERRRPTVGLDGHRYVIGGNPRVAAFAVAACPDGSRVATAGVQGEVSVWDPDTGRQLASWRAHRAPIWNARFSPDGTRLLTASQDGTTRVWEVATGRQVLKLGNETAWGSEEVPSNLAIGSCWAWFSPDGTKILTRDHAVAGARIWGAGDGSLIHHLAASEVLRGAGFGKDGSQVITSACRTGGAETRVWDTESGECRHILRGIALLNGSASSGLSPDGRHIVVSVAGQGLRIHELESGDLVRELPRVLDAASLAWYSPDGRYVAAMSTAERRVVVWNAATGAALLERSNARPLSRPEMFTPDSKALLLTSNSSLRMVPLDPLTVARVHRPRELTAPERERYGLPPRSGTPPATVGARPTSERDPFELEARAVEDLRREIAGVLASGEGRDEAELRLRLAVREVGLPDDALVLTLQQLGGERYAAGEIEAAEALFRAGYSHGRRALGPAHATTESLGLNLAYVLNRNGRPEEAEVILRGIVARSEARVGSWHEERPLLDLGFSLLAQDRPGEAERVFRSAILVLQRNCGEGYPGLARPESLLGEALLAQERWEEAEMTLLRSWERPKSRATPWLREVRSETRDLLVRLYEAWGKPEKAAEWRARRAD